jgi:hypothetical protein
MLAASSQKFSVNPDSTHLSDFFHDNIFAIIRDLAFLSKLEI